MFGPHNGGDFQMVFATRTDHVVQQLQCLRNIQNLQVHGRPFASKSFGSILFNSISRTVVHLDLDLAHLEGLDLSTSLGDTVLCPNVRSLALWVHQSYITIPLPIFLEQGIQRIRSLVPSDIESLQLNGFLRSDLSSSAISLAFFNKLKKLRCGSIRTATSYLPFAIPELINTNVGTLVNIEADLTTCSGEYYEELNWNDQVHALSLSGPAFYQKRHIYLPRLERCENLRTFLLEGDISDDDTVALEAFYDSLFVALSKSATQLIGVRIMWSSISPRRVWGILCALPNLDTLTFLGVAGARDFCPTADPAKFLGPVHPTLFFLCLQNGLSDVRKVMRDSSSSESDFWQDHATAIRDGMIRHSRFKIPSVGRT